MCIAKSVPFRFSVFGCGLVSTIFAHLTFHKMSPVDASGLDFLDVQRRMEIGHVLVNGHETSHF